MRSLRITLLPILVLLATTSLFAGSDAQKTFDKLKALAGSWEGKSNGDKLRATFRVTSNGSVIMSEMEAPPDNMITMFYLDGDRLMLTHYCVVGNHPRMVGKLSPDGKTVDFNFIDGTNFIDTQPGHMHRLVITMLDATHHSEDFTFISPDGGHEEHEHFDLHRRKPTSPVPASQHVQAKP